MQQERVVDDLAALRRQSRGSPRRSGRRRGSARRRVAASRVCVMRRPSGPEPPHVGQAGAANSPPVRNLCRRKTGWLWRSCDQPSREGRAGSPSASSQSKPRDLVVLAPRVVVAVLRARRARRRRAASARPARGAASSGSCAAAARASALISGSSVGPSTPRFHERLSSVPSLLLLAVRLVVLVVVRDEVAQREPVVRGDEVDRRERPAAVVARRGRSSPVNREANSAASACAAPEVAHRVAVHAVPLGPEHREVADLVAAGPDVPRLGDQLHLARAPGPGGSMSKNADRRSTS